VRIRSLEPITVSVPYKRRETSSRIKRDGVTAVLVKITTDDGIVGWGESSPGANVESVYEVVKSAVPIYTGRDPWERDLMAAEFYGAAHWYNREMTGHFAYSGIDMALNDVCGKACGQPLYNLFGGLSRAFVDYFCYLPYGSREEACEHARRGLEAGYSVYYIKVGLDVESELNAIEAIREVVGPRPKIRIDANGAWSVNEAVRFLAEFDRYHIDFAEQPVWPNPLENMIEVRNRTPIAICANEGLWRLCDVHEVIRRRAADVLCFSTHWVGSLGQFHRLSHHANLEGLKVCRHTHGELGLMAAASHHVSLTLPNLVDGNQQTAEMMEDDILTEPLPIASGPRWGVPRGAGLCVEVDEEKVRKYSRLYESRGPFVPYRPEMFGLPGQ